MRGLGALAALLLSAGLLLGGNGLLSTAITVRADLEGFSPLTVGVLGSVFFAGYIVGSFVGPLIIQRVGHIRTFAALAAVYGVAPLVHALVVDPAVWAMLRFGAGICIAGLSTVIESWINERAHGAQRGRVFSVYRIVDLGAVTTGQLLLGVVDPWGFELFSLVAIIFCLSVAPVAVTTSPAPAPTEAGRTSLRDLYILSPLGLVGVIAVGLVNSTFRLVAPLYVQGLGYSLTDVALFMAVAILGGAVLQWPWGGASDRFDRRLVILACTAGALASGLAMTLAGGWRIEMLLLTSFLFGGCTLPLYSLCVAHANDYAERGAFVQIAAGLLVAYGFGAIVGPALGAGAIQGFGPAALFWYTSVVHGSLLLFGLWRISRRGTVPAGLRGRFVPLLRTSPIFARLPLAGVDQTAPAAATADADAEAGQPPGALRPRRQRSEQ